MLAAILGVFRALIVLVTGGSMTTVEDANKVDEEEEEDSPELKKKYLEMGDMIWDEVPYDYDGDFETMTIAGMEGPASDFSKKGKHRLPRFQADARAAEAAGKPAPKFKENAVDPPPAGGAGLGRPRPGVLISEESIATNSQNSVWWHYDGKPRHVTKALRLEYKIKSPRDPAADSDGWVIKHLLVGYEGAVPFG